MCGADLSQLRGHICVVRIYVYGMCMCVCCGYASVVSMCVCDADMCTWCGYMYMIWIRAHCMGVYV